MNQISIIANRVSAKWRNRYVLQDVTFTLNAGENLLITGESGSGKTLLAKALAGKLFHQGEISFLVVEEKVQPAIVLVEQHYHFKNLSNTSQFYYQQRFNSFDADDAATVMEELKTALKSEFEEARANSLLKRFDLLHAANSRMTYLSSGEHKRFQLVKAFLLQPQIIILDEPFTGLDLQSRKQLKLALDAAVSLGSTCIIICKPTDAPTCITHISKMDEGKLIAFDRFIKENEVEKLETEFVSKPVPVEANYHAFLNAVVCKNVHIKYADRTILSGVNWTVQKGDHWWLKGQNGAGKSTLLSLITGDNPQAYANDISLFDKRRGTGESIWDIKKKIGYVSPELQWYFDTSISCFDTVASGLFDSIGLFKKLSDEENELVNEWLHYFGLAENAHQLLSSLSTGKQRLGLLARAMVKNPPLLILDEPCQGLDQQQKEFFIQTTEELCRHSERTLIYVSHYADDIPRCINKVIELNNGKELIYTISHRKQIAPLEIHTV